MKSLQQFFLETDTRDNVKNYLIEFLEREAVRKVFTKEDISGLADARDCIEKAFYNLEVLFGEKPKTKEAINEAR
ncbi:MAG: hypothetical protein PHS68_06085 [Candidatus Izemoplasmatales bacterium]|jgi:hypothetical protein|nr:hypothetical protein [Candidatus Izemoplasmatales bacterium]